MGFTSCESIDQEPVNPVSWFAVNGWSDTVTFDLYDLECGRPMRDIRLRPGDQIEVRSCGNDQNLASVRYRRSRSDAPAQAWTVENTVRSGQTLFMR